jgi:hypothetical protein
MDVMRKELREYIRATETLLSPASLGEPLTEEEWQIVEFYTASLSDQCSRLRRGIGRIEQFAERASTLTVEDNAVPPKHH